MEETLTHLNEAIEFVKGIAPDVWAIYLRQQIVEGWLMLAVPIAGLVTCLICLLLSHKGRPGTDAWRREEPAGIVWLVSAIFAGAFIIAVLAWGPYGIMHLFNPEYYAIKELLP